MNEELVDSAVCFLRDPGVASSPLNKKIEFLQSKGLNEQEIEEAMKRANSTDDQHQKITATPQISNFSAMQQQQPQQLQRPQLPYDYYAVAPQVPERSWKDYFIMATATAGVTYGMYQVISRYLLPTIIPPGQCRVDEDKEKIDEEFVRIDKVLEQMAIEQNEIKNANEAKLKEIDDCIGNVNEFLEKYNKDKTKYDDDLRLMKLEVDNMQNVIDKNLKLTKDNMHSELEDINDELSSLKNLIKARSGSSNGPDRKIVPVSSIPSASEILKKVKSNASSNSPKMASAPIAVSAAPVASPPTAAGVPTSQANATVTNEHIKLTNNEIKSTAESQAAPNFEAAGIPDWQLMHKQKEAEAEKTQFVSWEQSAVDEDKTVEDSIKKIGVPSWQLAAGK